MNFSKCIICCGVIIVVFATSSFVNGIGITFEQDTTLSIPQKELLDKFKTRVINKLPEDYMKTEMYLIKWLRSSGFDINVATTRILQNVAWRKEQKMSGIQNEDWSDMWDDDFRYYLDGRDNVGRSFLYFDVQHIDIRKAIINGKGERLLRYVNKGYDEACTLVRTIGEKNGNSTRGHLLINLAGYTNTQHACLRCIPVLLRMLLNYLENFPECVDKTIVVNAPTSVYQLLEIIRPLMDDDFRSTIFVYGTNKKQWKEALKQDFNFDQLPPALGGTKIYRGMDEQDDYNL